MTDGCRSARDGIFLYTLSLFYSAVVSLRVGSSLSPVIMTGTTCHREGIVPPRRKVYIFRRLSASDFVKQAALTAFGAIPLFGFEQSRFPQIVERTSDSGLRQLQLRGDGGDRRPTFAVLVGSVGKVGVDRHGSVRQFLAV